MMINILLKQKIGISQVLLNRPKKCILVFKYLETYLNVKGIAKQITTKEWFYNQIRSK